MNETNGAVIVSWDFSKDDTGVLIVGKQVRGPKGNRMEIINAFQGEEALEIYNKLINKT